MESATYNPNRSTWVNPNIEYLFNEEIIEYDMRDAGFSLIKQYKLLPSDTIRYLEALGKGDVRHIEIGKMQGADKEFSKALSNKFAEIREVFINTNGLNSDQIISVKKDAIFTINQCKRLRFGGITFVPKNSYTSYIRFTNIQNIEIYYSDNSVDVKGMSDNALNRHRLYIFQFIQDMIKLIERKDRRSKRMMIKFIDQYKRHDLDEGYYLEFNNMSRNINPIFNYQNIVVPLVQIITREID